MRLFSEISLTRSVQYYRLLRYFFLFLTAFALAQIGFSQSLIGKYELLLHLIYSLSFFWANGLFQAVLIKRGQIRDDKVLSLLSSVWGLLILIICILILVVLFFGGQLLQFLSGIHDLQQSSLVSWVALSSLAPLVFEYFLIAQKKSSSLIIWALISFPGHFMATLLPFLLGGDFDDMLWAHLGLNIARLSYMIIKLPLPNFNLRKIELGREALFLSLYTVIGGVPIAFDTWLIGWHTQSESQIALFRYGARELPLIIILLGGLHIGMLSDLSAQSDQIKTLKRRVLKAMHILAPISIGLMLLSPLLYEWVFTSAFRQSSVFFNIYLFLLLSRWIMSQTLVMAKGGFAFLMKTGGIELIINIVLSFIWIKMWGPEGVVWATIVAFFYEKVALAIWLRLKHNITLSSYLPIRWYFGYSAILIGVYIISRVWMY